MARYYMVEAERTVTERVRTVVRMPDNEAHRGGLIAWETFLEAERNDRLLAVWETHDKSKPEKVVVYEVGVLSADAEDLPQVLATAEVAVAEAKATVNMLLADVPIRGVFEYQGRTWLKLGSIGSRAKIVATDGCYCEVNTDNSDENNSVSYIGLAANVGFKMEIG